VLSKERTFFEKLLSLVRLSYDGPAKLKEKIRHFYDLQKLFADSDLQNNLLSDNSFKLLRLALGDDAKSEIFKGDWMNKPLSSSPLFNKVEETWKALEPTFRDELSQIVWRHPLPTSGEILTLLNSLKAFLENFDKQNS